jgi:hypothetical protein
MVCLTLLFAFRGQVLLFCFGIRFAKAAFNWDGWLRVAGNNQVSGGWARKAVAVVFVGFGRTVAHKSTVKGGNWNRGHLLKVNVLLGLAG